MMKFANLGSVIAKLIAAAMLFAALGRHPYDYYTLLRWVACGVCAFTAFQAVQNKKTGWLVVFITAAVVLNPIAPLRIKRDTWAIVDSAAAVLLLVSIAVMDIRKPKP
jgi:p-aminobenzoyl-glutamate transporter AbgT